MNTEYVFNQLENNIAIFTSLFSGISAEQVLWRPSADKWNLLEIVCHLYDEEREDFRARLKHVLDKNQEPLPPIDPVAWVIDRDYASRNFNEMVNSFIEERRKSVAWLRS